MTAHAAHRARQRAFTREDIEFVSENGTEREAPGRAIHMTIPREARLGLMAYHRHQIRLLERTADLALVVADGGALITVQHQYRHRSAA